MEKYCSVTRHALLSILEIYQKEISSRCGCFFFFFAKKKSKTTKACFQRRVFLCSLVDSIFFSFVIPKEGSACRSLALAAAPACLCHQAVRARTERRFERPANRVNRAIVDTATEQSASTQNEACIFERNNSTSYMRVRGQPKRVDALLATDAFGHGNQWRPRCCWST